MPGAPRICSCPRQRGTGIKETGSHPAYRWLTAPGAGLFSSNHQVCGLCFLWRHAPVVCWEVCMLPLNYAPKRRRGLDRASRTDYAPLGGWLHASSLCLTWC